ncbi:MAG TPA: class I SAM-dependent methyltransferase, partial [Planctomycetia bacterium]|nr:class I SAM-dependent methyltransferase [Planctomycetia bacterium]
AKDALKAPGLVAAAKRHRRDIVKTTLAETVEAACKAGLVFQAGQHPVEIRQLLEVLEELRPKTLCEIGSAAGGNLLLFSLAAHAEARMVSVDVAHTFDRRRAYPKLVGPEQRLTCLRGDSHSAECAERVSRALAGRPLDFLFIDGDHSYAGVKADFERYGPMVRTGGLVAFHDIVLDHRQRFGKETPSDTGGVPTYWKEISPRYPTAREIIADREQDGFGIGLFFIP